MSFFTWTQFEYQIVYKQGNVQLPIEYNGIFQTIQFKEFSDFFFQSSQIEFTNKRNDDLRWYFSIAFSTFDKIRLKSTWFR